MHTLIKVKFHNCDLYMTNKTVAMYLYANKFHEGFLNFAILQTTVLLCFYFIQNPLFNSGHQNGVHLKKLVYKTISFYISNF